MKDSDNILKALLILAKEMYLNGSTYDDISKITKKYNFSFHSNFYRIDISYKGDRFVKTSYGMKYYCLIGGEHPLNILKIEIHEKRRRKSNT